MVQALNHAKNGVDIAQELKHNSNAFDAFQSLNRNNDIFEAMIHDVRFIWWKPILRGLIGRKFSLEFAPSTLAQESISEAHENISPSTN